MIQHRIVVFFLMGFIGFLCSSCASVRPEIEAWQREGPPGTRHAVAIYPPSGQPHPGLLNKSNPVWWMGNIDDPQPPDWYIPDHRLRRFKWFCRNFLHNFDFYVIGVADKDIVRIGKYPEDVGNPNGGWNYAVTACGRRRLPFIAYNGKRVEWYIGWRNRGNFGIAVRAAHKK